jgi:hypothetical protein
MSKHPLVPGIGLDAIRNLLIRHQKANNRLLLATTVDHLGRPAEEADSFLRQLAEAGYLEWAVGRSEGRDWELTELALRLVADKLGPRMKREAVDSIVAKVIERARMINADPGRIARVVELRLFGSALDTTRKDYGDVDIETRITTRTLPPDEVAQARANISAQVPQSWRSDIILSHFAEETYDRRTAMRALSRGIKELSLSEEGQIKRLGCEYRTVYRFDPDGAKELAPDEAITPRTKPQRKVVEDISSSSPPARTVIRPLALAVPDEAVPTDDIHIRMEDLAYDEAIAWLGQSDARGGLRPIDTAPNPRQRFAGARYLFDEWRDQSLTGLELFQRTLDWASLYDLPISKASRSFTLRTYRNTRVANFHALVVQRVADRVEAALALNKSPYWDHPGCSDRTTPRMIAAHHALAVAFGRMIDETRLTGQVNFRTEFDLTGERRNSYPAIPDLSDISRGLRRLLPKVHLPDLVLQEALKRKCEYDVDLPVHREVEIKAYLDERTRNPVSSASIDITAEWWDPEPIEVDEVGIATYALLPGEERLLDACDIAEGRIKEAMEQLPGCRLISIRYQAPIHADTVEKGK